MCVHLHTVRSLGERGENGKEERKEDAERKTQMRRKNSVTDGNKTVPTKR